MRLLQLHGLWPLNIYDIARLGCEEYFAAEPLPASDAFADGQGPGLFVRRFGSRDIPAPVEGSEAYRIYQLGVLTRSDGVEQLVGLGVRTADLFAGDLPLPQRWALMTPDPLMLFHSTDGENWDEYSLGAIEKADGDYPLSSYYGEPFINPLEEDSLWNRPASIQNALMNSTAQWRSGVNEWGAPCLWTCSGTHLIEWDGFDARITPLGTRATALALLNGRFYFSAGSRTSIEATSGVLAFTDLDVTSLKPPLAGDDRIVLVSPGTNLLKLKDKPNAIPHSLQCVQFVGGQWLLFLAREWTERSARGETTKQELASFYLPSLPTEAVEIPTSGLEYLELSSPHEYFDLGRRSPSFGVPPGPPDPIVARRCSGRAYLFQRKDFQDQAGGLQIADMERETSPVLEMLCNPSLADFDITAALAHDEGHILGTADGYILSARIAQNRISALERLDSAVLKILKYSGQFYALTKSALWHSSNGTQWEVLQAAPELHLWRDMLLTSDERLFVVSNGADSGGPNSQVWVYNVAGAAPSASQTDSHATRVLDVLAEYSDQVYVFGTDDDGEFLTYDAVNEFFLSGDLLLAGENVTAAFASESTLFIGAQSGKLLAFDGAWSPLATAAHPIAVLKVSGDTVLLGFSDSGGVFGVWDGAAIDDYELSAPCATDARVFLDDGGAHGADPPCGVTILTDAGPVFWNCPRDDEGVWFSEVWQIEAGETWDEVLAFPLAANGSPLTARAFVGPADAGDDLTQYQPLEAGVNVRLLHAKSTLRFAVVHPLSELHTQYEFVAYRRQWS